MSASGRARVGRTHSGCPAVLAPQGAQPVDYTLTSRGPCFMLTLDIEALNKGGGVMLKSVPTLLVLKALASGPAHGYRIASLVNQASKGSLELREGTLYPLLHALERKGLIQGQWHRDPGGRELRVYELTTRGRGRLREDEKLWHRMAQGVDQVLEGGDPVHEPV